MSHVSIEMSPFESHGMFVKAGVLYCKCHKQGRTVILSSLN